MSRPMFDEMNASASSVRPHYQNYQRWLGRQPAPVMQARRAEAEMIFRRVGITFAVHGDKDDGNSETGEFSSSSKKSMALSAHKVPMPLKQKLVVR